MGEILKPTGGSTLNDSPARGIVNVTVEPWVLFIQVKFSHFNPRNGSVLTVGCDSNGPAFPYYPV